MLDTIRRLTSAVRRKPDPGDAKVYRTFKPKGSEFQPEAGTLPERRLASSGILVSNRASGANDAEVEMSAPENSVARVDDQHIGIAATEFAAQPNSIDATPVDAPRARPGAVGMYDYRHPDHPVNRAHQPDRIAQLQRGTHARAVARNTRSRRSR